MNKTYLAGAIFLLFSFISCQTGDENTAHKATEEVAEKSTEEIEPQEAIDDPLSSEDRNTTLYYTAQDVREDEYGLTLPDKVELKLLYEQIGPCDFQAILNTSSNYLLTHFYAGTDVENHYFVTFDLNGSLLDVNLYGTRAYGSDFTTDFISDNLIIVKHFHQEGFEIDESGNDTYDHLQIVGQYIYIKKDGHIQSIKNGNEASLISETSPELLDYYQQAIKHQLPDAAYKLYPFNTIPGNNTLSTTDVYESLEGGGLYSSCIEVRNATHTLIGVIGYKYDGMLDSIPNTYALLLNEKQKPIMRYGIIAIEGDLYIELVTLDLVIDNNVQIIKEYYVYPQEDLDTSFQQPVYSITGNLEELLDKPLEKNHIEKLKERNTNNG